MSTVSTKALYLFLCSILGMVLFVMLHRSIFVLYDLALVFDFDTYSFGMSMMTIRTIDFFTMIAALFLGGWYGTALGLDWHARVYGANSEKSVGTLHGFLPHSWRRDSDTDTVVTPKPVSKTVNVGAAMAAPAGTKNFVSKTVAAKSAPKPVAKPAPAAKSMTNTETPLAETAEWNFDDFLKATPAPKKSATSKKASIPVSTVPKMTKSSVADKPPVGGKPKAIKKTTVRKTAAASKVVKRSIEGKPPVEGKPKVVTETKVISE